MIKRSLTARLEERKPAPIDATTAQTIAEVEIAVCLAYGISPEELASGSSLHLVAKARALAADLLRGKCSNTQRAALWRVSSATIVYAQRLPTLDARAFAPFRSLALQRLAEISASLASESPSKEQKAVRRAVKKRAEQISEIINAARSGRDLQESQQAETL